jgi:hypothetical protein
LPGQGIYTLRLTVGDGRLVTSDELVLSASRATGDVTFVAAGSVWRYLDNGSDQGTAWREPGFADVAWKSGKAQLGYGDGDEVTTLGFGSDANTKSITTYFRLKFNVADAKSVTGLTAKVLRDDGVVVWVNGKLAVRDNMPESDATYLTLASNTVGGADESTFFDHLVDPGLLRDGENTIAAELHQSVASSSDISFDFALVGQVFPANRAPTADAGPDITVQLGTAAVLTATFADDGLPSPPGVPTFTWSKIGGPGTVTFADARSPRTTATFGEAGSYVVRFKADDGALNASDDVTITVVSGEVPPVVAVSLNEAGPVLRLTTDAGRSYSVQVRDELVVGAWATVQQVAAGAAGRVVEVPLAGAGPQRYYRVVSPSVP